MEATPSPAAPPGWHAAGAFLLLGSVVSLGCSAVASAWRTLQTTFSEGTKIAAGPVGQQLYILPPGFFGVFLDFFRPTATLWAVMVA